MLSRLILPIISPFLLFISLHLFLKLGATLANNNKSEEAIQVYAKALSERPTYARGWLNLGMMLQQSTAVYWEILFHYTRLALYKILLFEMYCTYCVSRADQMLHLKYCMP